MGMHRNACGADGVSRISDMPSHDPVQEVSNPDAGKVRSGPTRMLLLVLAVLSLGLGLLGIVTPGLPTT